MINKSLFSGNRNKTKVFHFIHTTRNCLKVALWFVIYIKSGMSFIEGDTTFWFCTYIFQWLEISRTIQIEYFQWIQKVYEILYKFYEKQEIIFILKLKR